VSIRRWEVQPGNDRSVVSACVMTDVTDLTPQRVAHGRADASRRYLVTSSWFALARYVTVRRHTSRDEATPTPHAGINHYHHYHHHTGAYRQAPFTRHNLLSNRLSNRFWQPVVSCKQGITERTGSHLNGRQTNVARGRNLRFSSSVWRLCLSNGNR